MTNKSSAGFGQWTADGINSENWNDETTNKTEKKGKDRCNQSEEDMLQNRTSVLFTLMLTAFVLLFAVASTMSYPDTLASTMSYPDIDQAATRALRLLQPPPRDLDLIFETIALAINRNPSELKFVPSKDPAAQAALWIAYKDRRQLQFDDPDLITRFSLATFYIASRGQNWTDCSARSVDEICFHVSPSTELNESGYRFLSGQHHCDWFGVFCTSTPERDVIGLVFDENNLQGTLASELALLNSLEQLQFVVNSMTGQLPSEYGSMNSLRDIQLYSNFLTGTVPQQYFELTSLQYLFLDLNFLTGTISTKVGQLVDLNSLSFYTNAFDGSVPSEVGNLRDLELFDWGANLFTGIIPSELGLLSNLLSLLLDENNFFGTLPQTFRNLKNLEDLFLSQNSFTGRIDFLYDLEKISFFDCSKNSLTGTIQPRIGDLKFLTYLALNENQFFGTIPNEIVPMPSSESKLQTFLVQLNNFFGTITDRLCDLYNFDLNDAWADCLSNGANPPEVVCSCCNVCCDSNGLCETNVLP